MQKTDELKVFISSRESKCGDCGEELGTHAWITLQGEKGALCLSCADLDHLVWEAREAVQSLQDEIIEKWRGND